MKTINASMIQVGTKERTTFPLTELMLEGNLDPVNKVIIKKGIPYKLDSLQWEILDAPETVVEAPVAETPVEETTPATPVEPANEVKTPQ